MTQNGHTFTSAPQTSTVLIDQVGEPPDAAQTDTIAETGEKELCGAAPLITLLVVIVIHLEGVLI